MLFGRKVLSLYTYNNKFTSVCVLVVFTVLCHLRKILFSQDQQKNPYNKF